MGVYSTISGIGLFCFQGNSPVHQGEIPTPRVVFPTATVRFSAHIMLRFGILPLPESGGKDKTTKMNMMMGQGFVAGAVAINGGVGVMEMRRPQVNMDFLPSVDDVMNSVAAVAAEIAVIAHFTLRELKAKIDAVTEK